MPRRGGDDPIVDLRVHPRELVARRALAKEPVLRVDADPEARTGDVLVDDAAEDGQERGEHRLVLRHADVPIERVEEPKSGVGRVVEALGRTLGEHVRNEPVLHVGGEGPEDRAGLGHATGVEAQPLEADHRVPTPVGEPVVAGDDASAVAGRRGRFAVRGGERPRRRDDHEGVGGEDEVRAHPAFERRMRLRQERAATRALDVEERARIDVGDRVPAVGRRDEGDHLALGEFDAEGARGPRPADGVVPAGALHLVLQVAKMCLAAREMGLFSGHHHAEGGELAVAHFDAFGTLVDFVRHRLARGDRRLVRAEVDERRERQARAPAEDAEMHDARVAVVRKEDALLDQRAAGEGAAPDREPVFEDELLHELTEERGRTVPFRDHVEVVERHDPPERGGMRRDEERVVAARDAPAERARCVAAGAVAHQPLSGDERGFGFAAAVAGQDDGRGVGLAVHQVASVGFVRFGGLVAVVGFEDFHCFQGRVPLPGPAESGPTGRKTSAAKAASESGSLAGGRTAPRPAYAGSSLVQRRSHLVPSGGARSGSGIGASKVVGPRFTTTRRSASPPARNRSANADGPSTVPCIQSERCAANVRSPRRSRRRSRWSASTSAWPGRARSDVSSLHRANVRSSWGAAKALGSSLASEGN